MKIEDFDFELGEEMIAQKRVHPFDEAKLLVWEKGEMKHKQVKNLAEILGKNDVLVFNDSKVIPARLFGKKKTGGKVEVLLLKDEGEGKWECLVRPGRSVKKGLELDFGEMKGEVLEEMEGGERVIGFLKKREEFWGVVAEIGEMPLPPYIKKSLKKEEEGEYQTCFADEKGSSAAPTAGLHFTDELLDELKKRGVELEFVTLHVGLGTFAKVSEEEMEEKKLHTEIFELDEGTCERLNEAKKAGKRIIAVGTTSVRVLESCASADGELKSGKRETDIFIQPGDDFRFVDGLMTNFHVPKSSLMMLVAALIGREKLLEIYEIAKREKYRFFSFGDACLFLPEK